MDRRGLPNNVFGVWGKGDPPAVGLDDRGHRGLLGGHTTLDALVIFQDAVEMGEGEGKVERKIYSPYNEKLGHLCEAIFLPTTCFFLC